MYEMSGWVSGFVSLGIGAATLVVLWCSYVVCSKLELNERICWGLGRGEGALGKFMR